MATYYVSAGVTSTSITLNQGDWMWVFSDGRTVDITANGGAIEYVFSRAGPSAPRVGGAVAGVEHFE